MSRLIKTFSYAIEGIVLAIKQERNMRIHLVFTFFVILLSFFLSLEMVEWIVIGFCIGGVISLELVNTAIERLVDLVTEEYHPLAKQAKDMAAGAVLLYAGFSVLVGIFIFGPKIIKLFMSFY